MIPNKLITNQKHSITTVGKFQSYIREYNIQRAPMALTREKLRSQALHFPICNKKYQIKISETPDKPIKVGIVILICEIPYK